MNSHLEWRLVPRGYCSKWPISEYQPTQLFTCYVSHLRRELECVARKNFLPLLFFKVLSASHHLLHLLAVYKNRVTQPLFQIIELILQTSGSKSGKLLKVNLSKETFFVFSLPVEIYLSMYLCGTFILTQKFSLDVFLQWRTTQKMSPRTGSLSA